MHAILYTRADCTLCDKAAHILERLAAEGLLTWEKRDIAASPASTAALADRIPVVALAKSEEVLYLPGQPKPLRLPPNSPALHLLQRVRNEAHRFALASHRQRRQKQTLTSFLEGIPGVGPKRRRALMDHFGTWDALRAASVEELARVPGISPKLAQRIWQALHGEGEKDMGTPQEKRGPEAPPRGL